MPKIKVVIPRKGSVTVSVNGVKGEGCKQLTSQLEKALGGIEKEELTEEYYESPDLAQNQDESQGQY